MDGVVCFNDAALSSHYARAEQAEREGAQDYHDKWHALDGELGFDDLIEAMARAEDEVDAAVATGRPELVGAVVLAIRAAYIDGLASDDAYNLPGEKTPQEAAREVLAAWSVRK